MKYFTEESLNELQEEIDLEIVCEALGLSTPETDGVYECPFCDNESLVLNPENTSTKYFCFECDSKGDAFTLIMGGWKQSFNDAANFLSILFRFPLEEVEKKDKPIIKNSSKHVIPLIIDILTHEDLSIEGLLCFTKVLDLLQKLEENKE